MSDAEEDKNDRLEMIRNAADPEDKYRMADTLLTESNAIDTQQQQQQQSRRSHGGVDEGSEEHWNLVMKKLAPAGYKKSPLWQKRIIERVIKTMTKRQKDEHPLGSKEKHTVDLAAIGLAPDTVAALQAEEVRPDDNAPPIPLGVVCVCSLTWSGVPQARVAKTMQNLPSPDSPSRMVRSAQPCCLACPLRDPARPSRTRAPAPRNPPTNAPSHRPALRLRPRSMSWRRQSR